MTDFVNRINTANQSIDREKKLPAKLAGKSHCDTVESSIKTKLSNVVFARWRRRAKPVKGGIERSVNSIIVDCVVVRSRLNSQNLNISMQNLFKVSKREGFQNGTLSEI